MSIGLSQAVIDARLQVLVDALDSGAAEGFIEFYTAPKPSVGAALTTQTLLGTCDFSAISGVVDTGVLTFNPISDDVAADDDGEIFWARAKNGDAAFVFDATCGIQGSGEAFIFNSLTAKAGGLIQVLSGIITEANA